MKVRDFFVKIVELIREEICKLASLKLVNHLKGEGKINLTAVESILIIILVEF